MSYLEYSKNYQSVVDIFMRDSKRYLPFAQLLEGTMNGVSDLLEPERETIALYVSSLNNCAYCVGSHSAVLRGLGVDAFVIASVATASTDHLEDPKMLVVLKFVKKLTLTPGDISQEDANALHASGFSDQAIEDIIGVVSMFSYLNRLVDGFGIEGSEESFNMAGAMVTQSGYAPVVKMIEEKASAA